MRCRRATHLRPADRAGSRRPAHRASWAVPPSRLLWTRAHGRRDSRCSDKSNAKSLNSVNDLGSSLVDVHRIRTEIDLICTVKYEVIRTTIDVQGKAHKMTGLG